MKRKRKSSDPWVSSPDLVREFMGVRPSYEELCREVEYILRKRLGGSDVEISAVTSRAKTLNSFLGKLVRKSYADPLSEVTDLAGVRVVCLYLDDIPAIDQIINDEFRVVERVDKLAEKQPNEFGYGALHFIVRLGKRSSGARYDDLRNLPCEIQVRTALQDAWAIIEHHLVYKSESAAPPEIQRKLGRLAAQLEDADDRFQQIRRERTVYVEAIRESTGERERFLATRLNLDSFKEYLVWKLPDRPVELGAGQMGFNLKVLQDAGYSTLDDIEQALDQDLLDSAVAVEHDLPAPFHRQDGRFPSSFLVALAIALGNKSAMDGLSERDPTFNDITPYARWSAIER